MLKRSQDSFDKKVHGILSQTQSIPDESRITIYNNVLQELQRSRKFQQTLKYKRSEQEKTQKKEQNIDPPQQDLDNKKSSDHGFFDM